MIWQRHTLTQNQITTTIIIDPSPWPFIGSVGALTMAIGGVAWMHVT